MRVHTRTLAAAVLGALALAPLVALAQETGSSAIPRTAWGDPDLGGIWDDSSITPMQRPAEYADQEYLTPDEPVAEPGVICWDCEPLR